MSQDSHPQPHTDADHYPDEHNPYDPHVICYLAEGHGISEVAAMNWNKPYATRSPYRIADRAIVRDVIAEAREYKARYVVWMRQHNEPQEWVEHFCARNLDELKQAIAEFQRGLTGKVTIVSLLDLHDADNSTVTQWVNMFFRKSPCALKHCCSQRAITFYEQVTLALEREEQRLAKKEAQSA